ncbi:hypothetical protein CC85DRAFT_299990 [Cutaneotrichosporon oleaginosum]|uniref:Uncharacterized protein n=1 Tax=Cutaneotrichosporon oleaginosum TaxID=879819 RepID=A0A0J0XVN3_9TREE|nr:uncharacterized protein CC85DRAFT_299990 [Cutaneotrichosporon oleaginosum]KLT45121.1 hypothetical protein CC85DRAFT_299990 [Cutaneotrichosporon oleaginosum]TXT09801.1 hypothetical protein COLE_03735 [Cutaneotrichosporon oleaginosum]
MFMCQWVPQCAVPMGPMTYGNYHTAPSQYLSMAMGSNAALQEEGVKSYIQWFTNDDQTRDLAHPGDIQNIVSLAKDEGKRKIILEVLKSRLGLGWPYNYRALDILSNLDPTYLIGMLDDISKFASPAAGVFGGEQLKLVTNTFIDKVKAAKKKKEDDELAKKHAEMMAMWGPLFTNEPAKPVYPAHLFFPHTASRPVPYPYVPPGLNCPPVTWANTAPEGWTSWVTPEARGVPKCCMPPW